MQTILVDCRYFDEIKGAWGDLYNILPSALCPKLAEPVAAHPDMVLFSAGSGSFVCAPEVYGYYSRLFSGLNIKLVQGESALSSNYPADIAYNVARVGGCLFGHPTSSDPAVLCLALKNGLQFYPTKQGYAKCSSCIISESALITSDPSIAGAAQDAGIDVLKIRPGHILLPGYDSGFIGGACGLTPSGELLCFGDISAHPDFALINKFCIKHGTSLCYLKNRPLTDIGTILSIDA